MALSSNRPEIRYSIIPQPVFVTPADSDASNGLEISHWLLTQKQMGTGAEKQLSTPKSPENVPAVRIEDPQFQDDMDDLSSRIVLLQTGGVLKENKTQEATSLPLQSPENHNNASRSQGIEDALPNPSIYR